MPQPILNENMRRLFNNIKDTYDFADENDFYEYMKDADNREAFRKDISNDWKVPDSATFSRDLGFEQEVQPNPKTPSYYTLQPSTPMGRVQELGRHQSHYFGRSFNPNPVPTSQAQNENLVQPTVTQEQPLPQPTTAVSPVQAVQEPGANDAITPSKPIESPEQTTQEPVANSPAVDIESLITQRAPSQSEPSAFKVADEALMGNGEGGQTVYSRIFDTVKDDYERFGGKEEQLAYANKMFGDYLKARSGMLVDELLKDLPEYGAIDEENRNKLLAEKYYSPEFQAKIDQYLKRVGVPKEKEWYMNNILKPALKNEFYRRYKYYGDITSLFDNPEHIADEQERRKMEEFIRDTFNADVDSIISNAEKEGREAYNEAYNSTRGGGLGYLGSGDLGSTLYAESKYREKSNPDRMVQILNDNIEGFIDSKLADESFQRSISEAAQRKGLSVEEYYDKFIAPQIGNTIYNSLYNKLVERELPKSTLEYIFKGITEDNVVAMLINRFRRSELEQEIINTADAMTSTGQNKYINPGMFSQATRFGVSMLADSWLWAGAGSIGGKFAGRALESEISSFARQYGIRETVAKALIEDEFRRRFGRDMARRIMQGSQSMGITLSLGNTTSEFARQIRDRNISVSDLADTAFREYLVGSTIGVFNGASGAALSRVSGFWPKNIARIASFGGESTAFWGAGQAYNWMNGDNTAFQNPLLGIMESAINLGVLKATSLHGIRDLYNTVRHPKATSKAEKSIFNKYDIETLKETLEGGELMDALASIAPDRIDVAKNSIENAAVKYENFMAQKDIPVELKNKVAYILGGAPVSYGAIVRAEPVGNHMDGYLIRTRDMDGNCVTEKVFKTEEEAQNWIKENEDLFERNRPIEDSYTINGKELTTYDAKGREVQRYEFENDDDLNALTEDIKARNTKKAVMSYALILDGKIEKQAYADVLAEEKEKDPDFDPKTLEEGGENYQKVLDRIDQLKEDNMYSEAVIYAFAAERGMETDDVVKMMEKKPSEYNDSEGELMKELEVRLHHEAFPPEQLHEEQSKYDGGTMAGDSPVVDENVSADISNELSSTEEELNRFIEQNGELGQTIHKMMDEQTPIDGIMLTIASDPDTGDSIKDEAMRLLARYENAQAKKEGYINKTGQNIDTYTERTVERNSFNGKIDDVPDDNIIKVVDADGNEYTLINGDVRETDDGRIEANDGVIIARDSEGNFVTLKADMMPRILERVSKDEYAETLRQQLGEAATEELLKTGMIEPPKEEAPAEEQPVPENGTPQEEKEHTYTVSDKTAKNGEHFFQDENGNIDLVEIPQEVFDAIGYTKAPVRLTPSMLEHVQMRHGKETGITNEQEAIAFVLDVMKNFDHVRLGNDGSLIFSIENGKDKTGKRAITILLNSDNGDFYGIKTSGYERMDSLVKRPLLWEGSAVITPSADAATTTVTTLDAQQSGEQIGSASDQSNRLSGNKGTEISDTNQENNVKNIPVAKNGRTKLYHLVDYDTALDDILKQPESKFVKGNNDPNSVADRRIKSADERMSKLDKKLKKRFDEQDFTQEEADDLIAYENGEEPQTEMGKYVKARNEIEEEKKYYEVLKARWNLRQAEEMSRKTGENKPVKQEAVEETPEAEVPEWRYDTPEAARKRGYKKMEGYKVSRPEEKEYPKGMEVEVQYSTDDKRRGHLTVSELDDVQGSHKTNGQRNPLHFIPEAQPKDEFGSDRQKKAQENATEEKFRPEMMLTFNNVQSAYSGSTSQTNKRGEVIQGNGRRNLAEYIYAPGNEKVAEKYKKYLMENAEKLGTTAEEIEKMKKPFAHIVLDVTDEDAIKLGQYKASDLESGGKQIPEADTTIKKLGKEFASFANIVQRSADEDASFAERIEENYMDALDWLRRRGAISDTEYKTLANDKEAGRTFIKNMLTDTLFRDAPEGMRKMFQELPTRIQNSILSVIGRDVNTPEEKQLKQVIQESIQAFHELSVGSEQFANAKGKYEERYAQASAAVNDWLRQINFDGTVNSEKFSNFAVELAKRYKSYTDQKTLQAQLNELYDLLNGTERETSMFDMPTEKRDYTLEEAISKVFGIEYKPKKQKENGQNGSMAVADNGEAGQGGERGGTGNAPSEERGAEGAGPADNRGGADADGPAEVKEQKITTPNPLEAISQAANSFRKKLSEKERKLRDAIVNHLRKAGIDVITDDAEGQRVLDEYNNRTSAGEEVEGGAIKTHKVEDKKTLDELNNGKTVKRYRAMQLIDGKLYPPMSAKVDGEMRKPTEIGVWEQAEERPDLIKNGKFVLNKGQKGQSTVPAAYNPYFHTSTSGLNDQFTSAYKRPELVVVEVEIPESELTSGYKAEGAKDAVGNVDWHSGVVNGQLPADRQRQVTLSRYSKVNRIVPDAEVADMIAKQLEGTNVEVPYNVVTPQLRKALEERGVKISDKPAGSVTEDINGNPIRQQKVENETTFYSNAVKAVEGIKQEKATPEQWLKMIEKAGGLKAGEDKWIGLSDWLKEQQAAGIKTLTKDAIQSFLRVNQIQVADAHYAETIDLDNNPRMKEFRGEFDELVSKYENEKNAVEDEANAFNDEMFEKYGQGWANDPDRLSKEDQMRNDEMIERWDKFNHTEPTELAFRDMVDKYGDDFNMAFEVNNGRLEPTMEPSMLYDDDISDAAKYFLEPEDNPINSTRLGYTTEGLDNKREIALVVPTIEPYNENDTIHFGDAGGGRAVAWVRFGDTTVPKKEKVIKVVKDFDEPYKNFKGMLVYYPKGEKFTGKDYIVYGKSKDGKMVYVPIMNQEQVAAFDTLDEARNAMNEWYKSHNVGETQYEKVLVIDEIQSKRHQDGRERGYKTELKEGSELYKEHKKLHDDYVQKERRHGEYVDKLFDKYGYDKYIADVETNEEKKKRLQYWQEMEDARLDLNRFENEHRLGNFAKEAVPRAPFEKNWHELAMKRMLRYAAENGYDKIAWTTGAQQAERYNLSTAINKIHSSDWEDYSNVYDGAGECKRVLVYDKNNEELLDMVVNREGKVIAGSREGAQANSLSDVVGKEMAIRLMEDGEKEITDDGLRIGGEGMKGFYDQILPRFMDKYGKKWGAKTGEVELPHLEESAQKMHSVDVTPEMKESVMEGQPMFFKTKDGQAYGFVKDGKIYIDPRMATAETPVHEYTHLWAEGMRKANPKKWNQIVDVLKNDKQLKPLWDKMEKEYPELTNDDQRAEEVLAQFSGKRGAEKLRAAAAEIEKEQGAEAANGFVDKVKKVLTDFWKAIAERFNLPFTSAEDVADMVMKDLMAGRNPNEWREKSLMGVHNISEEKLKKALKLGGLANPSLAVIDTNNNTHTDYGEISLIPKSSLLDAKTGRNAGTWTADAWTPTYPQVVKRMSKNGEKAYDKDLQRAIPGAENASVRSQMDIRFEDYLENGRNPESLALWYLAEKGLNPEIVRDERGGFDYYRTIAKAREQFKGHEEDFKKWLEEKEAAYGVEEYLWNGTDNQGRNKWVKNTVENASRLMKKQGRAGAVNWSGTGSMIATVAKRLNTKEQIKKNKENLSATQEEYDAFHDKWGNELYRLSEVCGDGNAWYGEARLQEALGENNPASYLEKEYGVRLSDEDKQVIRNFINEVQNKFPARYFETKFERPVGLDEFAVAVVPETTSPEIVDALKKAGLYVRTYDNTGEDAERNRRNATMEAVSNRDDILFHKKEEDKKISENPVEAIERSAKQFRKEQKEKLNNKTKGEKSEDLFLSLQNKKGEDYNETVNELTSRVLSGRARLGREDKESGREVLTAAGVGAQIIAADKGGIPAAASIRAEHDADKPVRAQIEEAIEEWAKPSGYWMSEDNVAQSSYDGKMLTKGGESKVYLSPDGKTVTKFNDPYQRNDGGLLKALRNIEVFNKLFPESAYKVVGFARDKSGRFNIVLEQQFIQGEQHEMEDYFQKGIDKKVEQYFDDRSMTDVYGDGVEFANEKYYVKDIHNGNVVVDKAGNVHIIDANAKYNEQYKGNVYGKDGFVLEDVETSGTNQKENDKLFRDGEAQTISINDNKKYTPKQMRQRKEFAERQWRRAHEWADDTVKKLNLSDNVAIVDSIEELEGWEKFPDKKKNAKGWYDPETGKIVVVMGNHRSPTDVVKTILHEGVAHHGLRELFGSNFDSFLDNAYKSSTKEIRDSIDKLTKKYDGDIRKATEEYLARLAEDTDFESAEGNTSAKHWFNKIKTYFLDMLRKLGVPGFDKYLVDLTDNELRYILWRSYKNLAEPGRYRNVFKGEDVAKEIKIPVKGNIENEIPNVVMNHSDEVSIAKKVSEMSLEEAQKAYKRIDDMMRDEQGRDLDEQFEAHKREYMEKNGLNGIGKFMADDLQEAMDKYGSGMIELRWELQDRISGAGHYARESSDPMKAIEIAANQWRSESAEKKEGKELYREGDEEEISNSKYIDSLIHLAEKNEDNKKYRIQAMKAIGLNLTKLRSAMSEQRKYDQGTVKQLVDLAQSLMKDMSIDELTRGEVKRLTSLIAKGAGKESIMESANRVYDLMLDHELSSLDKTLRKQLSVSNPKLNSSGVPVQGRLDVEGVRMARSFKSGLDLDAQSLNSRIESCLDKMGSDDEVERENAAAEYQGYMLAKQYQDDIKQSEIDERNLLNDLREESEKYYDYERVTLKDADGNIMYRKDGEPMTREVRHLKPEYKNDRKKMKEFREFEKEVDDAIRKLKTQRMEKYQSLLSNVGSGLKASMERAKAWREEQLKRVQEIQHNANSDLQGVPADEHSKPKLVDRITNWGPIRFFNRSLATFDTMLRFFGRKSPNGEGYLHRRFMSDYNKASDAEWRNLKADHNELDKKVSEVFGKKMKWSDLFSVERKMPGMDVELYDAGEKKTYHLTQGNMLYIYMVDKMNDGRMKLRHMGISEEDVEAIKENLDPRFVELADWLQSEYLTKKRNDFNKVHERMFGASMDNIENYFPLKINKRSRGVEEDVAMPEKDNDRPSTVTGSIIQRKVNTLPLDITGADAFDVVLEHLQDMEHWSAFAELSRDINTLLSYKRFKNRVKNMSSLQFGSGDALWNNFKDVSSIMAGTYQPKGFKDSVDKDLVNIAKGVTAAKISFRAYTALKQLLSYPAYLGETNLIDLAKSTMMPASAWKWATEELPGFTKRWQSRFAGDTRLQDTDLDWGSWKGWIGKASKLGMTPNAFVDALTVAMGAKAIYDTKYRQLIKDGYSEEQAKKKALNAATTSFNETQQSSENAYVSAVQLDRTATATALTVFRNASMAYTRRMASALRNLKHMMTPGYKEESLEYLKKQMVRDGLTEEQADAASKRAYNRALRRNIADTVIFGYVMQMAWNLGPYLPYLLLGDDDEEKKSMLENAAMHALVGSTEGLVGGNVISDLYNMKLEGKDISSYEFNLLPLLSDIRTTLKHFKNDDVAAWNDVVNILVQSGVGVNPQTLSDAMVAIMDATDGNPKTSREIALLALRLMQAPQSAIDKIYIDELGMSVRGAKKLDWDEMAQRYAEYKRRKGAPLTGWMYDEEGKEKANNRYIKRFENLVNQRIEVMDQDNLIEVYNDVDGLKAKKALGKEAAKRMGGEDTYGRNTQTEASKIYVEKRTYGDLGEDVLLYMSEKQAEERGDLDLAKEIKKGRDKISKLKKGLGNGNDRKVMEEIRMERTKALKKYRPDY